MVVGRSARLPEIKQLLRAALVVARSKPYIRHDKLQVFRARQALEKAHAFRHNADLAFYFAGIRGKVHRKKLHAAGSRRKQAC